jgi:O-methyltransferase
MIVQQPKRQLLHRVVPNRIALFDLINANADFNNFLAERCRGVPRFDRREPMYKFLAQEFAHDSSPVDYLEFGVWQGASLREWTRLLSAPDDRFFGFDSFQGLPEDWLSDKPKGTFDLNGEAPGFTDARISIVDGFYQDVLQHFLQGYDRTGRRLAVHIDCDLYSSTLFVLASIDRFLRPGDLLVLDEFAYLRDEFAAFMDYVCAFTPKFEVLALVARGEKLALRFGGRAA